MCIILILPFKPCIVCVHYTLLSQPFFCYKIWCLCSSCPRGPPESTEDSRQENGRVEDRELAEDGNENGELHTLGLKREEEEEEEEEANEVLQRRSSAVGSSNGSPEGEGRICAEDDIGRSGGGLTGAHHPCMSPESLPPADLVSLTSQEGVSIARGDEELIAPPETFGCDDSATATPTPQPETESMASGTITPRTSPCEGTNTPLSPLSPKPHPLKDSTPPAEVGIQHQPRQLF